MLIGKVVGILAATRESRLWEGLKLPVVKQVDIFRRGESAYGADLRPHSYSAQLLGGR